MDVGQMVRSEELCNPPAPWGAGRVHWLNAVPGMYFQIVCWDVGWHYLRNLVALSFERLLWALAGQHVAPFVRSNALCRPLGLG